MTKFRMRQKVVIIPSRKTDGRYNQGTVVGIEFVQDGCYLGYNSEKEYLARYTVPRYKVAYVDCVTLQASTTWFCENELSKIGELP